MDEINGYLSGKPIHGTLSLSPEVSSSLIDMLKHEKKYTAKIVSQRKEIMAQLDESRRVIAILRDLLSPIRRLPPEILAEMFLQYAQGRKESPCYGHWSKDRKKGDHFYHDLPSILLLAQVCSSWRQTIFAMPNLWSHIEFTIRRRYPTNQLLSEWFNRSANLPLDIVIAIPQRLYTGYGEAGFPFESLIGVCSRWHNLELDMSFCDMQPLLQHDPLVLPSLEKLVLSTSMITTHQRLPAFANAPRLTNISTSAKTTPAHAFDLSIPSSQVTELKLVNVCDSDPSQLYRFIQACTSLQSLSVKLCDIWNDVAAATIHLAHLRSLHVEFTGVVGSPIFLNAFKLPALKELVLRHPFNLADLRREWGEESEAYDDEDDCEFGPFGKLFQRTSPSTALMDLSGRSRFELLRLTLNGITSIKSNEILEVLRVIPSLEGLAIEDCYVDVADLCKGLIVKKLNTTQTERKGKGKKIQVQALDSDSDPVLLPNLTKIRLVQDNEWQHYKCEYEIEFDGHFDRAMEHRCYNTVSRMVESRWNPAYFNVSGSGYGGNESKQTQTQPEEWLDSLPVKRLTGGVEVSEGLLIPGDEDYYFDDEIDKSPYEEEKEKLKRFEEQGMPVRIL
ncbi:hypothetical protein VKT23_015808 [Stygiomarasmius scandens]|uniref:F-box domain-containing protein n=1 Tax=Marasmiellus scandens TaxID=2682957 RepID=A0ABR1J136_9AGAR